MENSMENSRQEILEALSMAADYIPKLCNGIQNVCDELTRERFADTDEYLGKIVQGINWVIEIFNATKEVVNEDGNVVDKAIVNQSVLKLNDALINKNDGMIAAVLREEFAPFLQKFLNACVAKVGAN